MARWRPAFLFQPAPGILGFAGRTTLAAVIALYVAYVLQLESPYWAATTALIVANPIHGQIVSKSVYRFLGTILGGIMAVLLAALFAQTPELFILVLSLWIGLCMMTATLLRDFTAYGAMLAGYTTAIIALAVVPDQPLLTFTTALARGAAIFVGITSSAIVSGLFKPGGAARTLEIRMRGALAEAAFLLGRLREPDPVADLRPRRRQLARSILEVDTLVGYAAAESPRIGEHREGLIGIAAALLHAITGLGGVGFAYLRLNPKEREMERLRAAFDEAADAGHDMDHFLAGGPLPDYGPARDRLTQLAFLSRERGDPSALPVLIHRLRETLEQLGLAAKGWMEWRMGRSIDPRLRAHFEHHRDVREAILNGVRCGVLTLISGMFWIITEWPDGATAVTFLAIFCCIASTQKDPLAFGMPFMKGMLIVIPVAGILAYGLSTKIEGFVPLAVIFAVPIFVGALALGSSDRRIVWAGFGFLIFLPTLTTFFNPMHYDFGAFLNTTLAALIGTGVSLVGSAFFLPIDPRRRARRLIRTICGEAEALVRMGPTALPSRLGWESRMYDRLSESMPYLATRAEEMEVLDSAYAALQIGASLLDLREEANDPCVESTWRKTVNAALDELYDMGSRAPEAAEEARAAAWLLLEAVPGLDATPERERQHLFLVRTAASLEGIALLLDAEGAVFHRVRQEAGAEAGEAKEGPAWA
jgi:uncharacterized membrane protein YccC